MSQMSKSSTLPEKRNAFRIKAERVPDVAPERESPEDYWFFYVRIFIETSERRDGDLMLEDIEYVKYELDPTFPDRFRMSRDRSKNFEIRIWTYGVFEVGARLVSSSGAVYGIRNNIEFEASEQEKIDNEGELEW